MVHGMSNSIKGSLYCCLHPEKWVKKKKVFCSDEQSTGLGVSHIQIFTMDA